MEMKFCPFCGRTPRIVENKFNLKAILYGVYCGDEHHEVSVGYFDSEEKAVEVWNDRKCVEESLQKKKYLNLKKGDNIYYVDFDNNEIEHGTIFSVALKNCKVDSFSVDFDCGDFDEFDGRALGVYFFTNKEDAESSLKNNA